MLKDAECLRTRLGTLRGNKARESINTTKHKEIPCLHIANRGFFYRLGGYDHLPTLFYLLDYLFTPLLWEKGNRIAIWLTAMFNERYSH